jgi:hypothetical protein
MLPPETQILEAGVADEVTALTEVQPVVLV